MYLRPPLLDERRCLVDANPMAIEEYRRGQEMPKPCKTFGLESGAIKIPETHVC